MSSTINERSGEALLILEWLSRVSKTTIKALRSPTLPFEALVLLAHAARTETPPRLSNLAAMSGQSQVQVSRLIKHLQKGKLATIKLDPTDGRSRLISVTAEGLRRLKKSDERLAEIITRDWHDDHMDRQNRGLRSLRLAKHQLTGESSAMKELGATKSAGATRAPVRRRRTKFKRDQGPGFFDSEGRPFPPAGQDQGS